MSKELIRFDWALKRLLRNKANFDVLEGFLSELLKFDIIIDKLGESEANQDAFLDKFNRVDIFAHTTDKQLVIIELQVDSELDYFHRMLYGVSKTITEYMNLGEPYSKVKKIYSINIVYFNLGQGSDYVYHGGVEFKGLHNNDVLKLSAKQQDKFGIPEVKNIFPEFYILKVNDFKDVALDGLDEWIYFLKNNEIKDSFSAKGIVEAKEKLKTNGMSPNEKKQYEYHLENKTYTASMLDTAKFEGLKEGIEKGIKEGIKEGIEKGEIQEKIKGILKSIQRNKLSIEEIAEDFEVTVAYILEIKNNSL